ncbi:PKD domain-containing protein, partial [Candidatus Woesearchaeota archaeon]|nr:PKD domain-containing protein [Candidatus Woesearchaeota archaeon]
MKRNYIFIICFFYLSLLVRAQTDKEFWFVAPDITQGHGSPGGEPMYLRFTAMGNASRTFICMPANPAFDTIWVDIAANSTQSVDLSAFKADIENFPNDQVNNKGLYIKSTDPSDPTLDGGDIIAYYDIDNPWNADIWALKGENALGKDFYVPFQNFWRNDLGYNPDPLSAIDIVATEDGTTIQITPTNDIVNSSGGVHPAGIPYTVTLNKGETYSAIAAGNLGSEHLGGTKIEVTSGGNIAVTISDDSIRKEGCRDINGDQLIPLSVIGHEYIVMKSQLNANDGGERLYVMATDDNTDVFIDGFYVTTIDEGESYCKVITNNSTHVEGSKPVYAYHVAGYGCEVGGAVLPTIDGCTGSNEVSFVRSTTATLPDFFLNLMIETGVDSAHKNFKIIYEDSSTFAIPPDWFEPVPGNPAWFTLKDSREAFSDNRGGGIPSGEVTKVVNSKNVFHLGFNNGDVSTTCKYGYFSNYIENTGEAEAVETSSQLILRCFNDTVALHASGGLWYKWIYLDDDSTSKYLSDPNVANPFAAPPPGLHKFKVRMGRACWNDTGIDIRVQIANEVIANFTIDKPVACSPLDITITNNSEGANDQNLWDFDGDGSWDQITTQTQKTITPPTYHNTSNKDTTFNVRLLAKNQPGCMDQQIRQVRLYPEITADFSVSDSMGCNPFPVDFTNQSSGDTADYRWTFGDIGTSTLVNPSHTYENLGASDSVYTAMLFAESPYHCLDTAWQDITVFPYIDVDFALDTATACAAHDAIIYNRSSGVDTFSLDFGDGTDTILYSFSSVRHLYENTDTVPVIDTITLVGVNARGCYDTMQRAITIFPQVLASFERDPTAGCDSVQIQFTNTSTGYQLSYNWDFGDNTSSSKTSPTHRFFNKTSDIIYDTVCLTATSTYYCVDTALAIVPVYPFAKADFAVDSAFGCPPFNIAIENKSINTGVYEWDFDGNSTIDSYN